MRSVVGAHYGLQSWLVQRMTAVYMTVFVLLFVVRWWWTAPVDYYSWRLFFIPQWFKMLTFLFVACLLYHAWVGVRDIYMDYIKWAMLRLFLHVFTILGLLAYGFWAIQIIWRL